MARCLTECLNEDDIFWNYHFLKRVHFINNRLLGIKKLWRGFMWIIIKDMILNDTCLRMPGSNKVFFLMAAIEGDDFIRCRTRGKSRSSIFADIDFIETNYTGYRPAIYYFRSGIRRRKIIYIGKLQKYVNLLTNLKKQYFGITERTFKDYIDEVWEIDKRFTREEVYDILNYGCKAFTKSLAYSSDFYFKSDTYGVVMLMTDIWFTDYEKWIRRKCVLMSRKIWYRALRGMILYDENITWIPILRAEWELYSLTGILELTRGRIAFLLFELCRFFYSSYTHFVRLNYSIPHLTDGLRRICTKDILEYRHMDRISIKDFSIQTKWNRINGCKSNKYV